MNASVAIILFVILEFKWITFITDDSNMCTNDYDCKGIYLLAHQYWHGQFHSLHTQPQVVEREGTQEKHNREAELHTHCRFLPIWTHIYGTHWVRGAAGGRKPLCRWRSSPSPRNHSWYASEVLDKIQIWWANHTTKTTPVPNRKCTASPMNSS